MIIINRSRWVRTLAAIGALLVIFMASAEIHAAGAKKPLKPRQVASFEQLTRLLSAKKIRANRYMMLKNYSLEDSPVGMNAMAAESGAVGHSETNVQVEGVDEGDSVKTDGQYIYSIQGGQVRIVRAYPSSNLEAVASLPVDQTFSPIELYAQDDLLIVIGAGWQADDAPVSENSGRAKVAAGWMPMGESRVMARVYDIADRANPVLQREITFTGDYLSSRRIGDSVYLIGRNYPRYYWSYLGAPSEGFRMTRSNLLPSISDSAAKNSEEHALPLADIAYFPGFVEPDYVVVAGFKLNAPTEAADIKAYLGGGDVVYASGRHLYLSAADYNYGNTGQATDTPVTHLYKFALDNGGVDFQVAGEVPGTVLNSFSMDEHNDYFRIATTVDLWTQTGDTGSFQNWNNLYTLDSEMKIVGRLEHLAEGERIYSARFIGERGYLVTFQQTDPLFVIDLSAPEAPRVLGELKIPGFSNYLHPFDENHLLGFGQDTEATENGVVTKGMKIALFDVTDVANPSQLHSLTIGAQGSYSPLMYDHKALWIDKQRGLLGFPLSETAQKPGEDWPTEIFQGAQVYKISLDGGFQKQAAISHLEAGQTYDWNRYIQRLLSIGDQLYTLSETRIQANDLTEFKQTGVLDFPFEEPPVCVSLGTSDAVDGDIASDCALLVDPFVAHAPAVIGAVEATR